MCICAFVHVCVFLCVWGRRKKWQEWRESVNHRGSTKHTDHLQPEYSLVFNILGEQNEITDMPYKSKFSKAFHVIKSLWKKSEQKHLALLSSFIFSIFHFIEIPIQSLSKEEVLVLLYGVICLFYLLSIKLKLGLGRREFIKIPIIDGKLSS